ncbi:hypothetical protein BDW02DRAFT_203109 [Decorospora gaudefroyi]|uniref:Uncharacterized protein n=1 Tax=Decorospora gaudefroyi TaxID=184978 RepID=A0A6A5KLQ2_9PLEO|nr:hypothetical protein BDW02DRAFT_203109 [Decorospora gaudefroyi]
MASQKRAPSIDMTSIELRNVSPAPTYISTFNTHDVPITPQHAYFAPTPKSGVSNNPYYQSTTYEPPQPKGKTSLKDDEAAPVKPDYQDPNHPHFAGPTFTNFPTALPARSRIPRKRILIPWILFVIFFFISVWYTSVLAGARFLDIIRPLPAPPTKQQINVYINGEALRGNMSVSVSMSTPTVATSTATSTLKPGGTPDLNWETSDDAGNHLGVATTSLGRRQELAAPTGFVAVVRRIG